MVYQTASKSYNVMPNKEAYPKAFDQCKFNMCSTKVEQSTLTAAAVDAEICGPGKSPAFIKELLQRTLIDRQIPCAAISEEGAIKTEHLAGREEWQDGGTSSRDHLGEGSKKKMVSVSLAHAVYRIIRNRSRNKFTSTNGVLQTLQSYANTAFCERRPSVIDVEAWRKRVYESAVQPGESLWSNAASFTRRAGNSHSGLSISQRAFLGGNLADDEHWEEVLEEGRLASLKAGTPPQDGI